VRFETVLRPTRHTFRDTAHHKPPQTLTRLVIELWWGIEAHSNGTSIERVQQDLARERQRLRQPSLYASLESAGGALEYKSLRPSEILLDPQNPRLPDGTSNDKEAINRLLTEGYVQLLALARDLMERGEANPAELPIVLKDGTKYVVLEGNRRFAALKLLGDPRLADDSGQQAAFARIKNRGGQPPKALYSAVAKDRDEADPWITLRHTGANDGVGVRVWSAEQNARHRSRMSVPIESGTLRSIAMADELTEAYQTDSELVELIAKVRAERLTNIGRFFTGVTLTRMQFVLRPGAEGSSQTLWAKHTAEELHDFFLWAFTFLDENSVDAFKNDNLRGTLLNENADVVPAASRSLPEYKRIADRPYTYTEADATGGEDDSNPGTDHQDGDDSNDGGAANSTGGSPSSSASGSSTSGSGTSNPVVGTPSKGVKQDQKPEKYLFSKVRLPNLSPNIQRLLKEAKELPIEENYAIACVLARVILELAVSDPKVLAWSGKKESQTLDKKIRGCIFKLDPSIDTPQRTRRDLVQANFEVNNIGVLYLHQFMHNSSVKPDPHLVRRFSAAYTPLLQSINEAVQ
jgi:hypothetical protein